MALQDPPGGVDVLFSHEAPAGIPVFGDATVNGFADEKVVAYCDAQRVLLHEALDAATPTWALHGHRHHFHTGTVHGTRRDGQLYTTQVIGLDRHGEPGNAAVLDVATARDAGSARPLIIPALSKRPWSRSPSEVARLAAAHRSAAPQQPSPSSVRSVPEGVMSRNPWKACAAAIPGCVPS